MKISGTDLAFAGLAMGLGAMCFAMAGADAFAAALGEAGGLMLVILPQLVGGVVIGGLIKQLVSKDRITTLLGENSGIRGLCLATLAGTLTPGGPFMSFPIVYALWTAGAEAGVLVAYITAWALLGLVKMVVWELPLMGFDFTLLRLVVSAPLPILAGFLARRLTRLYMFKPISRADP